jgi:adenylate kinase family enzyme
MVKIMKVAIIGNAGSGKSTLGDILHKKLDIPLYHLDQYYWKPGWQEPDPALFEKMHHQLCDKDTWIIEGAAVRLFDYRASKADIIIFLDIPTWLCLYRVLKRMIMNFGRVRPSSAPGCPEIMPSIKFLKFILNFNKERKPSIEHILEKYRTTKKVFIVKNMNEIAQILQYL